MRVLSKRRAEGITLGDRDYTPQRVGNQIRRANDVLILSGILLYYVVAHRSALKFIRIFESVLDDILFYLPICIN